MDLERSLLELEERFWKGDAEFYLRHLADDCLMVFAEPVGVLGREQIVAGIAAGPRWSEVRMESPRLARLSDAVAVLTYRATARREGETAAYEALSSSVYVDRGGAWRLALHQQTPG